VSSSDTAIVARSLIFNALFYVNITIRMIVALPTILLPYSFLHGVLRRYASSTLWFLRVVCGTKVEWRGREKLPAGPCIVACKHQSLWETFALFMLLPDPTYVLKRELMWLPLFGWLATKARMIPIDRGSHTKALASMTAALAARGSDAALAATRQLALIVRRQAEVLALADVFLALTVVFLGCVGLAALMRRPVAAGAGGGGH